ncbi:MAG: hypothetical protein JWM47_4553 [Acidimicrobiales bacterium]|nr:hypothetical protein [Acidimicrobiales bacterium]
MPAKKPLSEAQLRAAIRKDTRKIKVRQRAIQTLRKWRSSRRSQLAKLREGTPQHRREIAIKFFRDHAGWHEDAGRPNRASWLDAWARLIGEWMVGQPWCGLAVWMAARAAGIKLDPRTMSTVAIRDMAKAGTGGYKAWHDVNSGYVPKPGDVPVMGTGDPQHTGMVLDSSYQGEGNTSPGNGGSQNNGGGLYIRTQAERRGWVLGWAEIDWEHTS